MLSFEFEVLLAASQISLATKKNLMTSVSSVSRTKERLNLWQNAYLSHVYRCCTFHCHVFFLVPELPANAEFMFFCKREFILDSNQGMTMLRDICYFKIWEALSKIKLTSKRITCWYNRKWSERLYKFHNEQYSSLEEKQSLQYWRFC